MAEKELTLSAHFKELRRVIMISVVAIGLATMLCFGLWREVLMQWIVAPIQGDGQGLIFIGVSEAFIAYFKISILAGLVLASPIVIWQLYSFILPALYKNERRLLLVVSFLGTILFLAGIAFGYILVLKPALKILLFQFSGQFVPQITANYYLDFVGRFLLPFGLIFEMPACLGIGQSRYRQSGFIATVAALCCHHYFIFGGRIDTAGCRESTDAGLTDACSL